MSSRAQISLVAVAALLLTAAGVRLAARPEPAPAVRERRPIVDMTGRTVSIPARPERILSLCTSATDAIVRLGAGASLAGIDEYSRIVPGTADAVVMGRGSAISPEHVVARGVDLAFIWWYQDDVAAVLDRLGVPAVRITSGRAADVPAVITLIGRCIAREQEAAGLADRVTGYLRQAQERPAEPAPSVYLELYGPFKTAGAGSYMDDLLALAGGANVAAAAGGGSLLSPEHLIGADPDVILFVDEFATVESLRRRNGMEAISAVRSGRVHPIPRYWLVAGGGLPESVAGLRAIIHDGALPER